MKKALALLFTLLLLLPSVAFADVIVEPENGFYRTHQRECQHQEGRTYLTNGPDGEMNLYTAPGGTVAQTLKNGVSFFCQWTYTDKEGIVWGFSERHDAWAPLGYTLVQYDHIAFLQEHSNEIAPAADRTAANYETAFLYEYPGAPHPIRMDNVDLMAEQLYADAQGRQWGYVSYIYGIRNKWFCLDDPANGDLTGEKKAPLSSGFEAPKSLPAGSNTAVIAGVVGGVSLITLAVVLMLFCRKRKAE